MKTSFALISLLISSSALARQYFQCSTLDSYSTDVAVVNLQTAERGTLFLSSGMQNPENERLLFKIQFEKVEGSKHIYKVVENERDGEVVVPSEVIGRASSSVNIDVTYAGYGTTFSCFSAIYND